MTTERELTAVYAILGHSHVMAEPYDHRGAFVLLGNISTSLGDAAPHMIDLVSHLHMVAALGDNRGACHDAQRGMARLVDVLEQRLALIASP